jgi:uncharacterized protein
METNRGHLALFGECFVAEPVIPALDELDGEPIEAVWAHAPDVECKGLCADYCGPIDMAPVERARLEARGVTIPPLAEASRLLRGNPDWRCPALVDGRCSVYEDRPMICRIAGGIDVILRCPFGCRPKDHRLLTYQEGQQLLRLSERPRVR